MVNVGLNLRLDLIEYSLHIWGIANRILFAEPL